MKKGIKKNIQEKKSKEGRLKEEAELHPIKQKMLNMECKLKYKKSLLILSKQKVIIQNRIFHSNNQKTIVFTTQKYQFPNRKIQLKI